MGWRLVTRSLVSMLQMAMLAYAVGEASQCALHPIPLVFICSSAARDGTRRLLIQQGLHGVPLLSARHYDGLNGGRPALAEP